MMASILRPTLLRAAPAARSASFAAARPSPALARRAAPAPARAQATAAAAPAKVDFPLETKAAPDSLDFRIFLKQGGQTVSCWHDVPLHAGDGLLHFVCEIPKDSSAKMECATDEPRTPIKQDVKKGKLRFYPYNIHWNYGMLPQTWEDPAHKNADCLGAGGDNDPVDVVEIGSARAEMGGVYRVKPLGVYAMIDEGEVDWKVIAIRADDPKAARVNDVEDVEREFPGELQRVLEWFRDYKIPDGKPANQFGYDNRCLNREFAAGVVEETHAFYCALKSGKRANDEELSLI